MHTAALFLQQLYRNIPNGYAEIRLIHKSGDFGLAKKIYRPANAIHDCNFDYLAEMNSDYHVYHRVNVSNTPDSKKANISAIVALYVDIDDSSDNALVRLEEMNWPPTAVIYSGGGFHGYWLLNEPLVLASDQDRKEVERTMQGMILAYGDGADEKAKDVTRILRTPGFLNIKEKYETPPLCKIVYFDDAEFERYSFERLHKHYAPLGTPERPQIRRFIPTTTTENMPRIVTDYLQNGAPEGERNHRLYVVARWYNDMGKSQMDAEQDLIPRAVADGLEQAEANNTIRSAYHAPRNASNSLPKHLRNLMAIEDDMESAS
jgi:hypothetical protein